MPKRNVQKDNGTSWKLVGGFNPWRTVIFTLKSKEVLVAVDLEPLFYGDYWQSEEELA